MPLSKKAKRGINAFNRAKNPIYGAKRVSFTVDNTAQYVKAFLKLKEASIDQTHAKSSEVVG